MQIRTMLQHTRLLSNHVTPSVLLITIVLLQGH